MEKHFGIVEFEGKEYFLKQHAYLDSDFRHGYERAVYKAHAVDNQGNEYKVYWEPVEGWEKMEDQSDCCDWTEPYEVIEV